MGVRRSRGGGEVAAAAGALWPLSRPLAGQCCCTMCTVVHTVLAGSTPGCSVPYCAQGCRVPLAAHPPPSRQLLIDDLMPLMARPHQAGAPSSTRSYNACRSFPLTVSIRPWAAFGGAGRVRGCLSGRCALLCRSECPPLELGLSQLVAGLEVAWDARQQQWRSALYNCSWALLSRKMHMLRTAGTVAIHCRYCFNASAAKRAVFVHRYGTAMAIPGRTIVWGCYMLVAKQRCGKFYSACTVHEGRKVRCQLHRAELHLQ